ncbi:hypothetical protein Tco_0128190 [Tanacetum coccineum]
MGDVNLIRTLGDYSRPSHEGYMNTIELPKGNNMATIEELARYEDEGWNDPVVLEEESLDYENPDLKQLLGVMECKFGTLMENAISLIGRSETVFGMSSNMMRQLPSEPSCQEAFEDLVMNFILD